MRRACPPGAAENFGNSFPQPVINDSFAHPQKIQLPGNLWQIAYADGQLDVHENGLIGKIAELLHVTQGEYIGTKMRAKEAAGLALKAAGNAFHPA